MQTIQPGRYRHFKGGEYRVLGTARHSETLEELVVYQALYGERGLWVRPAAMWNEHVERDGYSGPRFTYIEMCIRDSLWGERTRLPAYLTLVCAVLLP